MTSCAQRVSVGSLAILLLLFPARARGEGTLDEPHAEGFYLARGGVLVAAAGISWATYTFLPPSSPAPVDKEWLGLDQTVRGHFSTSASVTSDLTGLATLTMPLVTFLDGGFTTRFANASAIYAEVIAANLLLNTTVKHLVPRLRPYTYGIPRRTTYIESQVYDAYLSFYSGHASTAFAAAMSGAYIFGASHPDDVTTRWIYGTETFLAATTAGLRIRAGKHYFSDVAVGIIVGSSLGIALPYAEGVRYRPSAVDVGFAAGGVVTGALAATFLPFHDDPLESSARARVRFAPFFGRGAAGISARGDF